MWSSGVGYEIYGWTLTAATLVPLQVRDFLAFYSKIACISDLKLFVIKGFFNCIIYIRPRYMKKMKSSINKRLSISFSRKSSLDGQNATSKSTRSEPHACDLNSCNKRTSMPPEEDVNTSENAMVVEK
jgi:hypothetical protein